MASGIIQKSRVSFNRYRISVYYFILYLFESIVDIFNTIRIFYQNGNRSLSGHSRPVDLMRSRSRQSESDKSISQLLNPKVRRRLPVPDDEDPFQEEEHRKVENPPGYKPIFSNGSN